jgi:hypothetical protein
MKFTASPDDQKSNHNGTQLSVNDLLKMMKASKPSRRKSSSQVSQQNAGSQIEMESRRFFFSRFRDYFHDRQQNMSSPYFVT